MKKRRKNEEAENIIKRIRHIYYIYYRNMMIFI